MADPQDEVREPGPAPDGPEALKDAIPQGKASEKGSYRDKWDVSLETTFVGIGGPVVLPVCLGMGTLIPQLWAKVEAKAT